MCSQHLLLPLIILLRFRVLQWRVWWNDPQPPVLHDLLAGHSRLLPCPFPTWHHTQQPPVYWKRRWIGEGVGRSPEPGLESEQLCLLLDTAAERGKPAEWRLWCCTAGDRWTWQSVSLVQKCHCMFVEITHQLLIENSIYFTHHSQFTGVGMCCTKCKIISELSSVEKRLRTRAESDVTPGVYSSRRSGSALTLLSRAGDSEQPSTIFFPPCKEAQSCKTGLTDSKWQWKNEGRLSLSKLVMDGVILLDGYKTSIKI